MSAREDLAAPIKNAFYEARDQGRTMHQAADDAADRLLRAGWRPPGGDGPAEGAEHGPHCNDGLPMPDDRVYECHGECLAAQPDRPGDQVDDGLGERIEALPVHHVRGGLPRLTDGAYVKWDDIRAALRAEPSTGATT